MQHPDHQKLEQLEKSLPKLKQKIANKSFTFDDKTTEYEMAYLGNLSDKDDKRDAKAMAKRFDSFPAGLEREVALETVEFVSEQPKLRYLYLARNQLKDLSGLAGFFVRGGEHFLDFSFKGNEKLQSPQRTAKTAEKKS